MRTHKFNIWPLAGSPVEKTSWLKFTVNIKRRKNQRPKKEIKTLVINHDMWVFMLLTGIGLFRYNNLSYSHREKILLGQGCRPQPILGQAASRAADCDFWRHSTPETFNYKYFIISLRISLFFILPWSKLVRGYFYYDII